MSTWAKPGVKCVCVETAKASNRIPGGIYPVVGHIYTVRATPIITKHKNPQKVGTPCLLVVEIVNANNVLGGGKEPGFPISAFRPIVTRTQEQDLEQFIPLLSTKPHEVDA